MLTSRFKCSAMFGWRHWPREVAIQPSPNVGLGAFDIAPLSPMPLPNQAGGAALGTDDVDSTAESGIMHASKIQRSLIVVNTFVVRRATTGVVGFAA